MLWKSLRLLGQFGRASWLVALHFPSLDRARRQQEIQRWAQQVLSILQIDVQASQLPPRDFAGLLVSNHLSWLDVLVLQSLMPVAFVAKAEVRRWPVVGALSQACATVFVDRQSVRSTGAMVHSTAQAIAQGYAVVAFPEGTSSDGSSVGRFHANIFESAIRTGTPVQPLCLHYTDARTGAVAHAAHFTGDMTLMTSLSNILRSPRLQASVQFGACIAPQGQTRQSLASQAHGQIRSLLALCTLAIAGTGAALAVQAQVLEAPVPPPAIALAFKDFYQQPTGTSAMEITPALRQADGRTVVLTGYMVQQERPAMGRFMLTPRPVRMSEEADGEADDLPAAWVLVLLDPSQQDFAVPHARGLVELRGVLSVGRQEAQDGRVSWVRLQLDNSATRNMSAFEVSNYQHSMQHSH